MGVAIIFVNGRGCGDVSLTNRRIKLMFMGKEGVGVKKGSQRYRRVKNNLLKLNLLFNFLMKKKL